MFVVNQSRTEVFNIDCAARIYVEVENGSLILEMPGETSGYILGRYQSCDKVKAAVILADMLKHITRGRTLYLVPTTAEVTELQTCGWTSDRSVWDNFEENNIPPWTAGI